MTNDDSNRRPGEPLPDGTFVQTPEQAAAVVASFGIRVDVVPGYEMLGELGRGAMGVVYHARDTRLNREVALKMILRPDATRLAVARFWAEAEVMAAVKHPHVVQVHELGDHAGRPFMAMEFVGGGSLEKRLESGPFGPREAAELLAKVASGVGAAHDLGIVHRDLKPGNILLAADGSPKVADFGIAKRKAHDLTQTNAMMGTPAYMAPEQAAARAKFVGPPADVWALGVILYECVAGKRPFAGDTVEAVFGRIMSTEPAALRTVVRAVPRDLDTIITKCLSKELEHRYATATELAADLGRFLRGEPITARPVGPIERFGRWVRRKPTAAAAYGFSSLAVLLAAVVFVVFGLYREAEGARDTADRAKGDVEVARDEAFKQKGIADQARDDALTLKGVADKEREAAFTLKGIAERAQANETKLREQVEREREKLAVFEYGRTIQVAHQEWRDNNLVAMRALLDGTNPKLRGWEWRYLNRLYEGSLLTLKGHTGVVMSACFSPDGSRIVTGGQTAKVWDARTGAELLTLKGDTGGLMSACFSPDGSRVVIGSFDQTGKVWDARTGAELLTLKGHTSFVTSACFSSDGSRIVTGSDDKTARVWDAKTGAELLTLKGHTSQVTSACFSPDGSRIVTGSDDGTAKVWDARRGAELLTLKSEPSKTPATGLTDAKTGAKLLTLAELRTLKGYTSQVYSACFSPDGSRIVTGGQTGKVWDARTGAELLTLKGHTSYVRSACFSPDGSRVVTGSGDQTGKVWDARTGAELLTLKGHTSYVTSACFSLDGLRVVTGSSDGTAKVWDAQTAAEVLTFKGHTSFVTSACFSPDGSRIVTGDQTGKVWDARTGAEVLTFKGHTSFVTSACFSPDGSQIVTGSDDQMAKVWDARTGAEVLTLKGHTGRVSSVCFSADGSRVVTGSEDRTARVWDARTGAEVLTLKAQARGLYSMTSACFSPDGSRIVTGDQTGKVWDARTGAEVLTLKGHTGLVRSACFSPDGSRIVTGSDDQTARVWDAQTGAEVLTLKHTSGVHSVCFSADGSRIVTGDRTTRVWDSRPFRDTRPPEPVRECAPPPRPVNR